MKYLASIVIVLLIAACGPSAEQQRATAQAAAAAKAERAAAAQAVLYQRNIDSGELELAAAPGDLVLARTPHTQGPTKVAARVDPYNVVSGSSVSVPINP